MPSIPLDNLDSGVEAGEDSMVNPSFVTGVTSLSISQIVRQDHHFKKALVLTVVLFLSLTCLVVALTLKINSLQGKLESSQDLCQVAANQNEKTSLDIEASILVIQNSTEASADEEFTTSSAFPTLKFGERPNVPWGRRWWIFFSRRRLALFWRNRGILSPRI